jgi:hypothetical protein
MAVSDHIWCCQTSALISGSPDKENLFFPLKYPTSCLLGCVDMLDCLPQEEYREMVKMWLNYSFVQSMAPTRCISLQRPVDPLTGFGKECIVGSG